MITQTIEIDRSAEDVFAYLDALDRHGEWQSTIVSARIEGNGPVGVGTRCIERRKMGGREQEMTYEITEHDPPRHSAFQGVDGMLRPVGSVDIEPIGESRSKLTVNFDLVGANLMGKLMAPLARGQARKQVIKDHEQLKAKLEAGA
jgi:uncharacterized membrane protein